LFLKHRQATNRIPGRILLLSQLPLERHLDVLGHSEFAMLSILLPPLFLALLSSAISTQT
jgi:hypothetical protein